MNRNEKGFTLIELVVVIAIIAVLTGAIIASINPIQATVAKQAASHTQQALLKAKQYAMTRGNDGNYIRLSTDNNNRLVATFYLNKNEVESEILSERKVTVNYSGINGDVLYVAFDKGSGGCNWFNSKPPVSADSGRSNTTEDNTVSISAGGTSYDVTISRLTGKIDTYRK